MREQSVKRLFLYLLVPIFLFSYGLPVYWLVVASLVPEKVLTETIFPFVGDNLKEITPRYYVSVIFRTDLLGSHFRVALMNSFRTSFITLVLVVFVSSLSAFTLTKFRFKGRRATLIMILAVQSTPVLATIIPWYLMTNQLGLWDTPFVLVIYYLFSYSPFITWVLAGFFQNFPWEIEEAALVDGCSHIQAFLRVILPVAAPGIAAAGIITFIGTWNEFTAPLLLTASDASRTIQPAIAEFGGSAILSTVSILALIPPVVLAIIFQDYLVGSLSTR